MLPCAHCPKLIGVNEVKVFADSTGREGPAVDPYHLACYLEAADMTLASNLPIRRFTHDQAVAAIGMTLGD